jgi:threonine/homoserine/homoserine lactone efflux protein
MGGDAMIGYVVQGIGLGFAGAAQPGPFQAYAISQTLKNGWKRSLSIALAPLVSDGPIIILVLLVLRQLPASIERVMHLGSAVFLAYLAWGAFTAWRTAGATPSTSVQPRDYGFLKAVGMNLISPGPYIYWSLVAGPTFLMGWRDGPASGVGFLTGFYATLIGTFAAIIMVFGMARQMGAKVNRVMLGISAGALACFAVYQLWLGILG